MTFIARLIGLFPLSVILLMILSFTKIVRDPSLIHFVLLLSSCYLYPLLAFHLHNFIFPLKEGSFDLAEKKHNPWWGSFQIQQTYYQLPFLESLLHVTPGLFSFWLRLWGSRIGKGVVWTPNIEINDRSLVEIGNHVVMGHKAHLLSHVIKPKKDGVLLIVKKIIINDNAFIGAGSRLGPGVKVDSGVVLPALSIGLPRQHFKSQGQAEENNKDQQVKTK